MLKLDLKILNRTVNFHFRDPYLGKEEYYNEDVLKAKQYVESLARIGIDMEISSENSENTNEENQDIEDNGNRGGVQRRLSLARVSSIKKFIDEDPDSILPGSIILSYNTYENDPVIEKLHNTSKDYGILYSQDFSDNSIIVIDGQHRLAGLLTSDTDENFEVPVSLFINSSLSESSRLFRDINGNQKPVNKSFIYDLYSNIDTEQYLIEAKLHKVCKVLNESEKSPFYKQIKMLGTGSGAISQSFFIEYGKQALKKVDAQELSAQKILDLFYLYFKNVQMVFSKYWPVPQNVSDLSSEEFKEYSKKIQSHSKLAKTNGIGALFLIFPYLFQLNETNIYFKNSLEFFDIQSTNTIEGSGKSTQNMIAKRTLKNLIIGGYNIQHDGFTKSIYEELNNK